MRIQFVGPVEKLLGMSEYSVTLRRASTLGEVVSLIAREFSHTPFFRENPTADELVPYVWMAVKNRKILVQPEDLLHDEDELRLFPALMGG